MAKSMGSYDLYTKGTSAAQQAKFLETATVLATGKTETEGESLNLNIPLSDMAGDKLPTGGSTGQVLKKTANGSEWANEKTEVPTDGTEGQVLMMKNGTPTWVALKDILPPYPNDWQYNYYVLGIDEEGKIAWVEDQTGGTGS
jgi:hypothetical protein